jgi:hypothetical protein
MIRCRVCKTLNEEDAVFCKNPDCRAYLGWEGEEDRPEQDAVHVELLGDDVLEVEPGEEVNCEVEVHNTGTVTDAFGLTVEGDCKPWARVDPATVHLLPDARGTARISFFPPRTPQVRAGPNRFEVKVTSHNRPELSVTQQGVVRVREFRDTAVTLVPVTSESRRRATHKLTVYNKGNAALHGRVQGSDPDNALKIFPDPPTMTIPPDQAQMSRLRLKASRWLLMGQPKRRAFQVQLNIEGQEPIRQDGAMNQLSLIPTWVLPVAAGVLALGLAAFAIFKPSPQENVAATSITPPTTALPPTTPAVPTTQTPATTPTTPTTSAPTTSTSTTTTTSTTSTTTPPPGQPLAIDNVEATNPAADSTDAAGKPVSFKPEHLIDNNPTTAWRTQGNGAGAKITLRWFQPQTIHKVGLLPGWALIDQGQNRFMQNRRVLKARISAGGASREVTFEDEAKTQFWDFAATTDALVIDILATTDLSDRDFTAVSDVQVIGPPGPEPG